jgi:hypothetical protein
VGRGRRRNAVSLVALRALGGVAPWSHWQFIGAFGVLEAASGIANVISPNVWRLPVAQLQTSERTQIGLAGSALLIPHWGALARFGAGAVLMAVAAWHEGLALASVALIPLVLALAWLVLVISASVLQFLLSISTIPAAKLLDPTVLYQPELAPSLEALLAVLIASAISGVLVYLLWSGRIAATAPAEQQREAEEHA